MPSHLPGIFLIALMLCWQNLLQAQCERSEYKIILPLIEQDLQDRNYERAINRLLDVRDICPDERQSINGMIRRAFVQIEKEKTTADSLVSVVKEERDKSNRVLDQMYFYEGKFGLTLKVMSLGQFRYGFIDKNGQEVIPFAFEEASPFRQEDGFARVKMEGKKYLLDTTGRTYLLAENLNELTEVTEALDLHEIAQTIDSLPENIGEYENIRIFLAYGHFLNQGKISRLPKSVIGLSNLHTLNLSYNQLTNLPEDIDKLTALTSLHLSGNKLTHVPESIGKLTTLTRLYLSSNDLTSVPESIGKLTALTRLYLSSNDLTSVPESIGKLTALTRLYLSSNDLTSVPESIGKLTALTILDLRFNKLTSLPSFLCNIRQVDVDRSLRSQLKEMCKD